LDIKKSLDYKIAALKSTERQINYFLYWVRTRPRKRITTAFNALKSGVTKPARKLIFEFLKIQRGLGRPNPICDDELLTAFSEICLHDLDKVLNVGNASAYLARSLHRKQIELLKRESHSGRPEPIAKETLTDEQTPLEVILRKSESARKYKDLFSKANPLQRKILEIKREHPDKNWTEIAEELDVPSNTVHVAVSGLRKELHKKPRKK
jgi:hypothetical protein